MAAHFEIPLVLIESLRAARHVAALTGSGISAESGVPTFRDAQTGPSASSGQALWSKYRPEELATPEAFRRNPRLVWELRFSSQEKRLGSEVYNTDAFIHNGQPL